MARKGKKNGMYGTKGQYAWRNTSGLNKGFHGKHSEESKFKISQSKLIKNPSHSALHKWVKRWKGKANCCKVCGQDEQGRKYEWANLSGEYKRDLDDYEMMCVPCHRKFDNNDKLYLHSPLYNKYTKK